MLRCGLHEKKPRSYLGDTVRSAGPAQLSLHRELGGRGGIWTTLFDRYVKHTLKISKIGICREFGPKEKRCPQLGLPCCWASQGKSVHNLKGRFRNGRKCVGPTRLDGHLQKVHSIRPRQTQVRRTKQLDIDKVTQKRILHEEEEREQHKKYAHSRARSQRG